MSKTRFILGPFRAEGVNLSGSDFVSGIPSPSAALGMVGAIAKDLGADLWSHRAILVIHDLFEKGGRVRGGQQIKGGKIAPLEISEAIAGIGSFSIIAEIEGVHAFGAILRSFERKRFAGGPVFAPRGKSFAQMLQVFDEIEFETVVKRLPRGFVLAPAVGVEGGNVVSFGEEMSLEMIARRIFDPREKKKGGYVTAVPCGYRVLKETLRDTPPAAARCGETPFAMAESAVGIGHFVSVRNTKAFPDLDTAFDTLGWSWSVDPTGEFIMFSEHHRNAIT